MSAPCTVRDCVGVQAIGQCLACRRAFCATHQGRALPGGGWPVGTVMLDRCVECLDNEHAARQAANRAAQAINEQASSSRQSEMEALAKQTSDPHELYVRLVALNARKASTNEDCDEFGYVVDDRDSIERLSVAAGLRLTTDLSQDIARWFASQMRRQGRVPQSTLVRRTEGSGMFRKAKEERVPGWAFRGGDTSRYSDRDGNWKGHQDLFVCEDGTLVPTNAFPEHHVPDQNQRFGSSLRVKGLLQMARLLGYPGAEEVVP